MAQKAASKRSYPWTTTIKDKKVTLRLLTAKDKDALLAFARSLPEDDLLFLSIDITNPDMVVHCIEQVNAGRFNVILAEVDSRIVGYGNLIISELTWSRHLGEIQLMVSREQRGLGIGSLLAEEVFAMAKNLGMQKLIARMASEQKGAIQVFERMGFHAEALLADFVIDRNNRTHDLMVMSYDVTGLTD
jgi:RimJ/RimL family protein N-acetyltransferase